MTKHTPALMIQGTCSNAGKSLLVAALCRIFAEDGLRPAPFKSQNMALNSFVTAEGGEIGRAQALQAVAAKREAHVLMNPVLLKPHSDIGSQVIVLGEAVGHMKVQEYIRYKPTAWKKITEAYDTLAATADVMVIEGAGSPAEINLKAHDIVNMAMAKYAKAPVLLCADIDRGGAFAALVGTMALLEPWEKDMVAGFLLNKFRGDARLLDTAFAPIQAMTHKPFVGTIPWMKDLHLPEEDSVSFHLYAAHGKDAECVAMPMLDVAVLVTPHMSNITDIDALKVEPDVHVRHVRYAHELGTPDILLLLGTKNTLTDIRHLKEQGLFAAIQEKKASIPYILGICGGLQMLGDSLEDPQGLESGVASSEKGLGFLPICTHMQAQKSLHRCTAQYTSAQENFTLEGYEIHHGHSVLLQESAIRAVSTVMHSQDGRPIGWQSCHSAHYVLGTYLHGILDNDAFRRHVLDSVRRLKGLEAVEKISLYTLGPGLERLAKEVRAHIDMDFIYSLLKSKSEC